MGSWASIINGGGGMGYSLLEKITYPSFRCLKRGTGKDLPSYKKTLPGIEAVKKLTLNPI